MIVQRATLTALLSVTSGCLTMDARSTRQTQEREDMLLIQEDVRQTSGRIEDFEMEIDRLRQEIDSVRFENDTVRERMHAMEMDITQVRDLIASMEKARQQDKQEIIDKLSAKINEIIKQNVAASGGSSRRVSDYGYEHVVGPGQTLSEIAAAYKVSMKAIIEANEMKNPNMLREGQKLFIPE